MPLRGMLTVQGESLLECPLCGQLVAVKASKTGKPYLICNDCGLQMFVRFPAGQARLDGILEAGLSDLAEQYKM